MAQSHSFFFALVFSLSTNGSLSNRTLPDFGEETALRRLDDFCARVGQFYEPGAQLLVMSDGRVFADLVGVPDENVTKYRHTLHRLVPVKHISWDTLDNHISNEDNDHDAVRQEMMDRFCTMTMDDLVLFLFTFFWNNITK